MTASLKDFFGLPSEMQTDDKSPTAKQSFVPSFGNAEASPSTPKQQDQNPNNRTKP